jgi:hypothetical protein
MFLHTVEPKNAAQVIARTTEPERIQLRMANDDRLDYMRQTTFASDGPPTMETMVQVRETLLANFIKASEGTWWEKQTWNW